MKISIIGGGSYGATLGQVLADNGHSILIREILPDRVAVINEGNHPFFSCVLPKSVKATLDLKEALDYASLIVLCVPTVAMRSVLTEINSLLDKPKTMINVSKGIEPETLLTISQIATEVINPQFLAGFATLSGPSHAEELIERKLTTFVAASESFSVALMVQQLFSIERYVRVYTSLDIIGVEVGGAVKNAIALVSGIANGLGLGENARAALISRGLLEIVAIAVALGGKRETVYGLSGVGDLIVTASSLNSRNFQAGLRIGRGEKLSSVLEGASMAVEGVRTVISAHEIALKYNLDLPIIDMTYEVLYENGDINTALPRILARQLKVE